MICCGIIIIGLLVTPVSAGEVEYNGAPPLNARAVEALAAQPWPGSVLADSVATLLLNNGYVDAEVETEGDTLMVCAGLKYKLGRLVFLGDSTFELNCDKDFSRSNLNGAIDAVLEDFYGRGYFFASVGVELFRRDEQEVTAELLLNQGPLVRVGTAVYTGLTRTGAEGIARYMPVREGDTLTGRMVRRAERAAAAVPYVRFRGPARISPREGYRVADLVFEFSEKKQFRLEGGGGYVPGSGAGLMWSLELTFTNLFGQGKEATVRSERRERGRNVLDVSYRQPLFLLGAGATRLSACSRDYREQFQEFSLGSEFTTSLSPEMSTGLGLGWKSVVPADGRPEYDRFTAQFSISRETVEDQANPASGLLLRWQISYSYRRYESHSLSAAVERCSFNDTRTHLSLKAYQLVSGPLVAHVGVTYAGLETDETLPPLSELTFVGGPGSLRGFRNEQFAAMRTALGTIEPRLRFGDGYFFLFYDGAYLNSRDLGEGGRVRTEELYRSGYGVGLALAERSRSVKISIGWNGEADFDRPRLSVEFFSDI